MASDIAASLPALVGFFAEGVTTTAISASLPSLLTEDFSGSKTSATIAITLPGFSELFHGVNAPLASISITLGWPSIASMEAALGGAGHLSFTLPSVAPSIHWLVGNAIRIAGEINIVEALLGAHLDGLGRIGAEILYTDIFGTPTMDLPIPTVSLTGLTGVVGQISGAIPVEQFYAHGLTGNVGSLDLELPFIFYDAQLLSEGIITLDITLPALITDSYGNQDEVGVSYRVVLMNMINKGVSEYNDLHVNSMAEFNGDTIAIRNDNSLIKVAPMLDDTEEIVSKLQLGTIDFSDPVIVKPRDIWVTLRSGQKIKLTMKADEQGENEQSYYSEDFEKSLRKTRVKIGRGWYDNFYDFEFENVDGEHIDISSIHIMSEPVRGKKR